MRRSGSCGHCSLLSLAKLGFNGRFKRRRLKSIHYLHRDSIMHTIYSDLALSCTIVAAAAISAVSSPSASPPVLTSPVAASPNAVYGTVNNIEVVAVDSGTSGYRLTARAGDAGIFAAIGVPDAAHGRYEYATTVNRLAIYGPTNPLDLRQLGRNS